MCIRDRLEALDGMLSDTYFCNFSLFQSMPDSWAVKQLFPIMPIHRLNEMPTRNGVLGDISCDSDGKIDQFIDRRDVKPVSYTHLDVYKRQVIYTPAIATIGLLCVKMTVPVSRTFWCAVP